jgi:hypothetical protein
MIITYFIVNLIVLETLRVKDLLKFGFVSNLIFSTLITLTLLIPEMNVFKIINTNSNTVYFLSILLFTNAIEGIIDYKNEQFDFNITRTINLVALVFYFSEEMVTILTAVVLLICSMLKRSQQDLKLINTKIRYTLPLLLSIPALRELGAHTEIIHYFSLVMILFITFVEPFKITSYRLMALLLIISTTFESVNVFYILYTILFVSFIILNALFRNKFISKKNLKIKYLERFLEKIVLANEKKESYFVPTSSKLTIKSKKSDNYLSIKIKHVNDIKEVYFLTLGLMCILFMYIIFRY